MTGISDTDTIIIYARPEGDKEDFNKITTIESNKITYATQIGLERFINDKLRTCVVWKLNEVITYLQNDGWEVKIQRNNQDISHNEINEIKIRRTVEGWNGIFQPHITIQMPLEKVVDVYNNLYSNLDTITDTKAKDPQSLKTINTEHQKN